MECTRAAGYKSSSASPSLERLLSPCPQLPIVGYSAMVSWHLADSLRTFRMGLARVNAARLAAALHKIGPDESVDDPLIGYRIVYYDGLTGIGQLWVFEALSTLPASGETELPAHLGPPSWISRLLFSFDRQNPCHMRDYSGLLCIRDHLRFHRCLDSREVEVENSLLLSGTHGLRLSVLFVPLLVGDLQAFYRPAEKKSATLQIIGAYCSLLFGKMRDIPCAGRHNLPYQVEQTRQRQMRPPGDDLRDDAHMLAYSIPRPSRSFQRVVTYRFGAPCG